MTKKTEYWALSYTPDGPVALLVEHLGAGKFFVINGQWHGQFEKDKNNIVMENGQEHPAFKRWTGNSLPGEHKDYNSVLETIRKELKNAPTDDGGAPRAA
jgi:hypothetical protein